MWRRGLVLAALLVAGAWGAAQKTEDLDCMFLGYPELEYDGFDRTEVCGVWPNHGNRAGYCRF